MSERLSMMPGYCTEHDLRFDRLGCPICVMDKFDDPRPTLSPEAQAVLELAESWRRAIEGSEPGRAGVFGGKSEYVWQCELFDACRALATLSPKDYAPDELRAGTRFRFATAGKNGPVFTLGMDILGWYYVSIKGRRRSSFDPEDRLIPIDQDD